MSRHSSLPLSADGVVDTPTPPPPGVKHVVFSSVAGADQTAGIVDHFHTKHLVEQHIQASKIPYWTVVRPVGFMEVFPPPGALARFFFWGAFAALMGDTKQKYVACDDIGRAVAKALLEPKRFHGRILTVCGEVAGLAEVVSAVERGEGRKGWGWCWLPRWLVIRLTPRHYRQMFDVSVLTSVGFLGCADWWVSGFTTRIASRGARRRRERCWGK